MKNGVVMTPAPVVNMILDVAGYHGGLNEKIIEPSFGDGAFLCEIVRRILDSCESQGVGKEDAKRYLEDNIYGFELDEKNYEKAIEKINAAAAACGVEGMEWKHLVCGDTLKNFQGFCKFFDFVVGNPPYIKIHDMDKKTKETLRDFEYTTGTTDIYIAFLEMGLKLLKETGRLAMITPNSYLKNTSQQKFRDYLASNHLVQAVYDFKSDKIFAESVYCCVSILGKSEQTTFQICSYQNSAVSFLDKQALPSGEFQKKYIKNRWNITTSCDAEFLEEIEKKPKKFSDYASIQNGISTNATDVYTVDAYYDPEMKKKCSGRLAARQTVYVKTKEKEKRPIESGLLRRAAKASKYAGEEDIEYLIFPYNERFELYDEETMKTRFPLGYQYLLEKKEKLQKRDMEKDSSSGWYAYARSQGIKNSRQKKLVFKQIQKKETKKIEVHMLDEDILVYGGAFVTAENEEKLKEMQKIMETESFARYCVVTGEDRANGYVHVGTKSVKEFRFG